MVRIEGIDKKGKKAVIETNSTEAAKRFIDQLDVFEYKIPRGSEQEKSKRRRDERGYE